MYWNGAYYTDALLILLWGIWCWQIYQTEIRKPEPPPAQNATAFV